MPSLMKNIGLSVFTFLSRIVSGSIVYIALARLMSLNDFGVLSFGTTLAGLLTVVAEFGFSLMAQRDIPQQKFNFNDYVFNTFLQKIGFAVISLAGGLIYLKLFYTELNYIVGVIFVVNAIITSNNMYFFAVFRAKNIFKVETWVSSIYMLIMLVLIALYVVYDLDVIFIAYGLLFARCLQLIILILIYLHKFNLNAKINTRIQKYLFRSSFSFGAHYIIGVFYFSIDNQLVAYYGGNEELAIYQSILRVVLLLLSVSALFESVFLPYLSSRFNEDSHSFKFLAIIINKVVITIGLTLFMGFNLFSHEIITILYSEKYLEALTIVLPLSVVLLLRIITSVYSVLLTISDHQNIRVLIAVISLLVNLSLNFIFIPKYGYVGAAYVSVVTHIVSTFVYVLFLYKYLNSFLINTKMVLFGLATVSLIIVKFIISQDNNILHSISIMIIWLILLLFLYSRKQIIEIVELVKGKY